MATNETKTIRVWMSTYKKIQGWKGIPSQLSSDAAKIDFLVEKSKALEAELEDGAMKQALDDICKLIEVPDWEYPGQVVRDVASRLDMTLDEMGKKLLATRQPSAEIVEEHIIRGD
jgi:hypothetical protein